MVLQILNQSLLKQILRSVLKVGQKRYVFEKYFKILWFELYVLIMYIGVHIYHICDMARLYTSTDAEKKWTPPTR